MAAWPARAALATLLTASLLLTGSVMTSSPLAVTVRDEARTSYYLWGNLTWTAGQGGISWAPNSPSEMTGGEAMTATTLVSEQTYVAASTVRQITGQDDLHGLPPPDNFVSEPLEKDLHINVTRLLQLDLYVASTSTSDTVDPLDLDVELWAGNTFVAGGVGGQALAWYAAYHYAAPPGYTLLHYRMPSEAASIPKGTQLRLSIIHVTQNSAVAYMTGRDPDYPGVRSQLRIPYYSPEDWLFRDPAAAAGIGAGVPPTTSSSASAAGSSDRSDASRTVTAGASSAAGAAAIAGLGAVAGLASPLGGRRGRSILIVLVFFAMALAGCAGHAPAKAAGLNANQGRIENTFIPDDGSLTTGGNGTIIGVVHDEIHVPLTKVNIFVLGTSVSTASATGGRFTLANLPPRTYTVRFEKEAFRAFETRIEVKPGQISRPDVLLFPVDAKTADYRPHLHDLWNGATVVPVLDVTKAPACDLSADNLLAAAELDTGCSFAVSFQLHNTDELPENIVLPGTYEVEVKFGWDEAATGIHRLGLLATTGHDRGEQYFYGNVTEYAPHAPGQPFHMQTGWETTDRGHQRLSSWQFAVYLAPADYPGAVKTYENNLWMVNDPPKLHVQVWLHKGVVPYEPAHTDWWGDAQTIVPMRTPYTQLNGCSVDLSTGGQGYWGNPKYVIPEGTKWIEATMTQTRATNPHVDWFLAYRRADQPLDLDPAAWPQKLDSTSDGTHTTWKIPVDPSQTDDIYLTSSHWSFTTYVKGDAKNYCIDLYANTGYTLDVGSVLKARFKVTAHRDAMP